MAGMVAGDFFDAVMPGNPSTIVPATSTAAKPSNAKPSGPESQKMTEARSALWLAATCIVIAIAILGFGSKYLNNMRIA